MKLDLFRLFLFLAFPLTLHGQMTFLKTFGGWGAQAGYAVKECFDGGFIITGYDDLPLSVWRTNSDGDTLWTKTYPFGYSTGFDVIQTPDSNFVVSGHIGDANPKMLLMKVNDSGTTLWTNKLCYGWGQAVQTTLDGNLISAGYALMKTNAYGDTLWCKPVPETQVMYLLEAQDSQYVLCGYKGSNIYLQKRDTSGTLIWTTSFPGQQHNTSNNILTQSKGGGYLLAGIDGFGNSLLIHTDPDGLFLWNDTINDFICTAVIQTTEGGYALGGYNFHGVCNLQLIKTDSVGRQEWTRTYCPPDQAPSHNFPTEIKSIRQTKDKGYILTGQYESSTHYSLDMILIKTDSLGTIHTTGMEEPQPHERFAFSPNPFRSTTRLSLDQEPAEATIVVYNLIGQLMHAKTAITGRIIEIDRGDIPAGIYIACLLERGALKTTQKLVITD